LLSVQAVAGQYTDSTGKKYSSESAIILKSKDDTLVLDTSCYALSKKYGEGNWNWSNGGFLVSFGENEKKVSIGFPREEVDIDDQGKCGRSRASDKQGAADDFRCKAVRRPPQPKRRFVAD